jgi:hypothetical protein
MFRDTLEVALVKLKRYWETCRHEIPFPLEVGAAFVQIEKIQAEDVEETVEVSTDLVNTFVEENGTS